MKILQKADNGEWRERLLHEYFFNAYLIASLKQAGRKVGRIRSLGTGRDSRQGAKA